jgi:hypothetical protein
MVRRDRYTDAQINRMPIAAQVQEEVLWDRLRGLDYLSWALGSGCEQETVEVLFGPGILPENPVYGDEDEPESPGMREAGLRVKVLREQVEAEYSTLSQYIASHA